MSVIAWTEIIATVRVKFPRLAQCRFRHEKGHLSYFLADWQGRMQCVQITYSDVHTTDMVAVVLVAELQQMGVTA